MPVYLVYIGCKQFHSLYLPFCASYPECMVMRTVNGLDCKFLASKDARFSVSFLERSTEVYWNIFGRKFYQHVTLCLRHHSPNWGMFTRFLKGTFFLLFSCFLFYKNASDCLQVRQVKLRIAYLTSSNNGIACEDETWRRWHFVQRFYVAMMDTQVNFWCPALVNVTRATVVKT